MDFIVKKSNGGDVSRETSPKDKAPEVTGMNRVVDFIAQKLNPEWFPTSGRTLLETAQGVKTPITEKNFKSEELDIIRQLIALKGSDNGSITYGDYLALAQKLNKDGPPPTSITPGLYSMGDPLGNVHTTLGRFSYRTDPKGNLQVVDKYDFNPPMLQDMREARTGDYGVFGTPYNMIREYAGEKIPPGTGRDVLINLGRIGQKARPVAKFAQGSPNPDEVPSVIDEREEIRSESQRMLNRLKSSQQAPQYAGFTKGLRASQLKGYGEDQRGIELLKEFADMPRGVLGATPIIPGGEGYRTGQAVGSGVMPAKVAGMAGDAATGLAALGGAGVRMGQSAKAAVQQPGAAVASAKRGVEELGDTAAAQLARISRPNELGSQAGIVRPPGGYFPTSRTPTAMTPGRSISNLDEAFDPVLQEVRKIRDPEARQALTTLFNQKAKDFFTKQAGSIDDPLREAILSGEIKFPEGSPKNMGDRFATKLQEGVAAGDLQSLRILNKEYDDMIGIRSVVPRRAGAPEVRDVVRSQIMAHIRDNLDKIPDAQLLAYADKKPVPRSKAMLAYAELTPQEKARYSGIQSYRVAKAAEEVRQKLKENPTLFSVILEPRIARTVFEQSKNVSDIDMARFPKISGGPSVENLVSPGMQTPEFGGVVPPGYFLPELETAVNKGQPIFDLSSTNASFLRLLGMSPEELLQQARQIPVKELNKTSFPDFVKKAYANFQQLSQYEASLPKIKKNIEAGKAPPSDAMLYGVENFLPTNDGFRWVKVVKPDAVKAIASGMNNSVGSYATSTTYGSLSKGRSALENGEVEIYSLYDKNNVPHMTVEYLTQKASHSDPKLKTSDLKNSIMQFTGSGPLTGNKFPSEEYRAQVIDLVKKLKPQRVPVHIQELLDKS